MSEQHSADERARFKKTTGRRLSGFVSIRLSHAPKPGARKYVRLHSTLAERMRTGQILLGIDEAIRLRDWLDRALP
jgi:hypothetical protein